MSITEKSLTALALALLTLWELAIGAIPLGLFVIEYSAQPWLFVISTGVQLAVAVLWLSRVDISVRLRSRLRHQSAKPLLHTP